MRINTRVRLIIIPIIIIGSLCVATLVYQSEKYALIRQERINLQLQLKRIAFMADSYVAFSDAYFSTLIRSNSLQNVMIQNDKSLTAYSVENILATLLSELLTLEVGDFSIAILDSNNTTTYFFEDSNDPFSEPDDKFITYNKFLYSNDVMNYKKVLKGENGLKVIQAKVLNPITMKEPVSKTNIHSKSIMMMFGMLEFDSLIASLESSGYRLKFISTDGKIDALNNEYGLSLLEEVFPDIWLQIEFDSNHINSALIDILLKLFIFTLLIVVIISTSILFLISRSLTNPILDLRKKILAVNNGKSFMRPQKAHDEIGLLNIAYYDLYIKLKSSYEKSQELSSIDKLTKLNNRDVFNSMLEGLLSRETENEKLSILYIDIDNFKYINDSFGHEAGDVFLVEFAAVLRSILRPTDLVLDRVCEASRLAGDEFGVIIHDYNDDAIIKHIALRITSIFKDGFKSSIGTLPVSASIGISVYPNDGNTPSTLIANADSAMYQSKRNGKNQYNFYSKELADIAKREFNIELELKKIDFTEFQLFYMPIINAESKLISSVEALIRWSSESLGQVSPDEFIPIAEMKGYFKEIDFWVFNNALENFVELKQIVGVEGKISINISSAQLSTSDFIPTIIESLDNSGITADHFILEITETFSTKVTPLIIDNLNSLKAKGFQLALDDFGSGYTSLIQLIDYPIDIIKIDKSMIDRIETQGSQIVASLTSVCQSNGYSVTAEGVESIKQVNALEEIGINSMQGYFFCKPMPLNELSKKYKNRN
jgi:diguanylate cyclase (GGDEF)-like protein